MGDILVLALEYQRCGQGNCKHWSQRKALCCADHLCLALPQFCGSSAPALPLQAEPHGLIILAPGRLNFRAVQPIRCINMRRVREERGGVLLLAVSCIVAASTLHCAHPGLGQSLLLCLSPVTSLLIRLLSQWSI